MTYYTTSFNKGTRRYVSVLFAILQTKSNGFLGFKFNSDNFEDVLYEKMYGIYLRYEVPKSPICGFALFEDRVDVFRNEGCTIGELVKYVDTILIENLVRYEKNFLDEKRKYDNGLASLAPTGEQLFIFKSVYGGDSVGADSRFESYTEARKQNIITDGASDVILFAREKNNTKKQFSNVKGKTAESVIRDLEFFRDNERVYYDKGIPYHYTALLHGHPGTGKTSIVKASSNELKRHIIMIDGNILRCKKQLYALFNDPYIYVAEESFNDNRFSGKSLKEEENVTKYFVPISERIYVFEEMDILQNLGKRILGSGKSSGLGGGKYNDKAITLVDFLNILDGTTEQPGRLIFFTTNEKIVLDKALKRPGRIDASVLFKPPTSDEIYDFINSFMDNESIREKIVVYKEENEIECSLGYSELQKILFGFYKRKDFDIDDILMEIKSVDTKVKLEDSQDLEYIKKEIQQQKEKNEQVR